jgi:uncharacterized protein YdiU (UPF0061 family)
MLAGIGPERPVACYLATAVLTWWNVAQDRSMHIPFDNSYAQLPERFYARLEPTPVAAPALVRVNDRLARLLGLDPDELRSPAGVAVLAGNAVPEGGDPMALAYAGHQFGHFVPQLGDGRAILLGEVVGRDGVRRDIQLKGSGPTPFSRSGDGRAALGPVLREYLISEAMAALGIPTTRTLAAVTTGETVWRETRLPGAVLTRVAASHVRVGTFQYLAARRDEDGLLTLADYAISRHYPAVAAGDYRGFLEAVVARQADLVAQWLLVGFIHGVMNTDNTSVAGETIDYGPCAFMDEYDPGTVFSSIDHQGRYAYGNQPRIALWNLTRLAECLLPLLDNNETTATEALATFAPRFEAAYHGGLRRDGDDELAQSLLRLMAAAKADFTLTFRGLCDAADGRDAAFRIQLNDADAWLQRWRVRLAQESTPGAAMRAVNPMFIPRNHLVEAALAAAVERSDYEPFNALLAVVTRPFDDDPELAPYAVSPREEERVLQTFCGT